jgi:diaminopimelate decarboxylase
VNPFVYRDAVLGVEGITLIEAADRVGTPFYCYAAGELERRYRALAEAVAPSGTAIAFAVKANSNLAVIGLFAGLGAGADVVSEGELRRCLAAGVSARRILFSGVGKTGTEIGHAIESGIGQINLESETEIDLVAREARHAGRIVPVALRVNPDVSAGGHEKISTGRKTDKFGIAAEDAPAVYARMAAAEGLEAVGIAMHIGSQIRDVGAYGAAFTRMAEIAEDLRRRGLPVSRIDLGGGLGVAYGADDSELPLEGYGRLLVDLKARTGAELTIEPGRWLVADAGVLVSRVITVKQAGNRRFVVVDAAMNDLIRPTLYDAHHPVWPVAQADPQRCHPATVAGPVCESGDILAVDAPLPDMAPGDLIAIGKAGAYGAVMASSYNSRLLVPEAMVRDGRLEIVRRRPSFDEAMALDSLPDWSRAQA